MSDHVHKFNATLITSASNPVLRCACGWWRAGSGKPIAPDSPRARGFESRLAAEREPDVELTARPSAPQEHASFTGRSADTTAAVDEVLRGSRRP